MIPQSYLANAPTRQQRILHYRIVEVALFELPCTLLVHGIKRLFKDFRVIIRACINQCVPPPVQQVLQFEITVSFLLSDQ